MLFTAIVGTVMMLPLAIYGLPGDGAEHESPAQQTQLAEQPLTGLPPGETIREVSQPTPFSLVALTGEDLTGTTVRVRAKRTDGSWGPWFDADTVETTAFDAAKGGPRGTEPIFVGS